MTKANHEKIEADPLVTRLMKDLTQNTRDGVHFANGRYLHWLSEMAETPVESRGDVMTSLLANRLKLQRVSPEATEVARIQLGMMLKVIVDAQIAAGVAVSSENFATSRTADRQARQRRLLGRDTPLMAPMVGEKKENSGFVIPRRLR